jgi:hypothetical protein
MAEFVLLLLVILMQQDANKYNLITWVMFISAWRWPNYKVETCSTSYVYIKQIKHLPTFIEGIPTLSVVSMVIK